MVMVAARPNSGIWIFGVRTTWPVLGLGLICLSAMMLSGCKKADEIRTYTVAHRATPELVIQRMLGAIIPNSKEAWFFKLQGGDDEVTKLQPQFLDFTKSVAVKEGKVTWKAPDTWQEKAGGEFRFTTFLIPNGKGQKPFELAISRLDAPEGVNDKYLVANLSRWRGQLGLDPITAEEVAAIATKVDFNGGSAWFVSFAGMPSPANSMTPPFMNNGAPAGHPPIPSEPAKEAAPSTAAPAAGSSGFEFTTPQGWAPGKPSSMRKASLAAVDGDAVADISVFAFPADANDLLSNVNRWRGQVGLAAVSADELQKSSKKVDVGGHAGDYVELVGEKETIFGVMVKKGETAWFFKLQGPTVLAGREKTKFEEFVKSARLP